MMSIKKEKQDFQYLMLWWNTSKVPRMLAMYNLKENSNENIKVDSISVNHNRSLKEIHGLSAYHILYTVTETDLLLE